MSLPFHKNRQGVKKRRLLRLRPRTLSASAGLSLSTVDVRRALQFGSPHVVRPMPKEMRNEEVPNRAWRRYGRSCTGALEVRVQWMASKGAAAPTTCCGGEKLLPSP